MKRILICVATGPEADACWRGIRRSNRETEFELLRTGMGSLTATSATRQLLQERLQAPGSKLPELIISTGFAGLWNGTNRNGVKVGSRVCAQQVWREHGGLIESLGSHGLRPLRSRQMAEAIPVHLVTVNEVKRSGHTELDWAQSTSNAPLPVVVDMESAAIFEVARSFQIDFGVLRIITDTPEQPLPEFVATWSAAFLEKNISKKTRLIGRGLRDALTHPTGVHRLIKDGREWSGELEQLWTEFAVTELEHIS